MTAISEDDPIDTKTARRILCHCGDSTWHRMRNDHEDFPSPDFMLGSKPLWLPSKIRAFRDKHFKIV